MTTQGRKALLGVAALLLLLLWCCMILHVKIHHTTQHNPARHNPARLDASLPELNLSADPALPCPARSPRNLLQRLASPQTAEDARESVIEGASDVKRGAKKAAARAESAADEGAKKSRGWFSRIFRRGKVRAAWE